MNYKEFRKTLTNCPFCNVSKDEILIENEFSIVLASRAPYNRGHLMIIPKRHVIYLSELKKEERECFFDLIFVVQNKIRNKYGGFSSVYREGKSVGKSIPHAHYNIIPNMKLGPVGNIDFRDRKVYSEEEYSKEIGQLKKVIS